jgi:hypothetical protein
MTRSEFKDCCFLAAGAQRLRIMRLVAGKEQQLERQLFYSVSLRLTSLKYIVPPDLALTSLINF